mmetsp:Transcript_124881/g.278812  ORF Transcript_124881/g.278812 Transcript_124881/m.278812 type:complete len:846 (+) Transcript_124881:122-2659(+)
MAPPRGSGMATRTPTVTASTPGMVEVAEEEDEPAAGCGTCGEEGICGGGQGLFVQAERTTRTSTWRHVGDGRGHYQMVDDMKYVGHGRGSFELEAVRDMAWRFRNSCIGCVGLWALTALVLWLWTCWRVDPAEPREMRVVTSLPYDCAAGLSNWRAGWSINKKAWCCQHAGVACAAAPCHHGCGAPTNPCHHGCWAPAPTTSYCAYDCFAGYSNWQKGWSASKKVYCCAHEGRGCPAPVTTSLPYDCNAGAANWRNGWSERKKAWCCSHASRGCPTTTTPCPTVTSLAFDCLAGFSQMDTLWSLSKRSWCCANRGRGCTTTSTTLGPTTTSLPFDCLDGFYTWEATWSVPKQIWCCEHRGRGCPTTQPPFFDCLSGNPNTWTAGEKDFCCMKHGLGCPTTAIPSTTRLSYDCLNDYSDFGQSWGLAKKAWCCQNHGRGCNTTSTTLPKRVATPPPTTPTPTSTAAPKAPLACKLNCYGDGATPVQLPGATGFGDSTAVEGIELEACRALCRKEASCDGIVYGANKCYGKKDIHTSKCQKSQGTYETEVLSGRPWGYCVLVGDPHIITWDSPHGPSTSQYRTGEFYLVKSDTLTVTGRFGFTKRFRDASSTVGLAISGAYIKDHSLSVAWVGPEEGYKGFKVFWDKQEILQKFPSTFKSQDGFFTAKHDAMDPTDFHREGRHTIGGTSGNLPSYLFLLGSDIKIYMLLGPDSCNAVIEAKKLPVPQDGFCGNFNCDGDDDTFRALHDRGMHHKVPKEKSIFDVRLKATKFQMTETGKVPTTENCEISLLNKAKASCSKLPEPHKTDCIFDVCASGDTKVASESLAIEEVDEQVDADEQSKNVSISR